MSEQDNWDQMTEQQRKVYWPKRGLVLRVLGAKTGNLGETRLVVCKVECPNPVAGQFSVRADDVVSA